MSRIALFDLDATLANFHAALRRDLARIQSPSEPELYSHEAEEKFPHIKARYDLIKRQPNWWANLEPMEDGFSVLAAARAVGFKIHICTRASSNNADSWRQKVEWVNQYVNATPGIAPAKITITQDKGIVYGRVLVDDWPSYIKSWLKHRPRGLVIMPDRPWNADFSHPQVVRLVSSVPLADQAVLHLAAGGAGLPAGYVPPVKWSDHAGLQALLKVQYDRPAFTRAA